MQNREPNIMKPNLLPSRLRRLLVRARHLYIQLTASSMVLLLSQWSTVLPRL